MIVRVPADLELRAELAQLAPAQHRPALAVAARYVERAAKSVAGEELGDSQVERMTVVPRGGEPRSSLHRDDSERDWIVVVVRIEHARVGEILDSDAL